MYLLTTNSPPQGNGRNVLHLDCHAEAFRHKKRTPQFCGVLLYKLLKSLISAVLFLFLRTSGNQFFHILGSVEQNRGCCEVAEGKYEITIYTSCCNADKGIYYYTTYDNHQISAVDMHKENLEAKELIRYSPIKEEQIYFQNGK